MTDEWELVDYLPPWMEKRGSNNDDLLRPVQDRFEEIETDVLEVQKEINPVTAQRRDTLSEDGKLVGTPSFSSDLEAFRRLILLRSFANTTQSTAPQLVRGLSVLLGVEPQNISYLGRPHNFEGGGVTEFSVPYEATEAVGLDPKTVAEEMTRFCSAGYRINLITSGTLAYISPNDYENGAYDEEHGYDTLESGEPTGKGGTYSGYTRSGTN